MEAAEIGPSLLGAFARVPDVRSRHGCQGRRYPLPDPVPALLTWATAAMLSGALTYAAVWVIALAVWQAEHLYFIRSPRVVLAHVWEGWET